MERALVKIRTKKGRFITLTISEIKDGHYIGTDKYGEPVIISSEEIDSMLPLNTGDHLE